METPHPHAVFWIDVAKIATNPYQPRKYFDEARLQDLSDSIRRYGVLQPIVVTRKEEMTPEGGMIASYELIAGERRLRASRMAGLEKIPAIIREDESTDEEKLELAILENLQREDLNPVDRARSFGRLIDEFGLTHAQVGERLGKSREYVSNSMRLLALPDHMLNALSQNRISEGHTRPLLMLKERPDEQETLFMQLINASGGMTVREAETFARSIAKEKQRVNKDLDPEMKEIQQKLSRRLGAKVSIDKGAQGGKVTIEFGNKDDLRLLLEKVQRQVHDAEVERQVQQGAQTESMQTLSAATPLATNTISTEGTPTTPQDILAESVPFEEQSRYSFNTLTNQQLSNKDDQVADMVEGIRSSNTDLFSNEIPTNIVADPEALQKEKLAEETAQIPVEKTSTLSKEISDDFITQMKDVKTVRNDQVTAPESEHEIANLQKEMEAFASQFQSRVADDQKVPGMETQVELEELTDELAQFAVQPLTTESVSEHIQDMTMTGSQVTNTQNNPQDLMAQGQEATPVDSVQENPASAIEMQAQFVGNDFKPSEPVISTTDGLSVGSDFVPGGMPEEKKGNDNEPFDLSRFTI